MNELFEQMGDEMVIFPPNLIMKRFDWAAIQQQIEEKIRWDNVALAGSKHEAMLLVARIAHIDKLNDWMQLPLHLEGRLKDRLFVLWKLAFLKQNNDLLKTTS